MFEYIGSVPNVPPSSIKNVKLVPFAKLVQAWEDEFSSYAKVKGSVNNGLSATNSYIYH